MKVVVGSDHCGLALKCFLLKLPSIGGIEIGWLDIGAFDESRSDYPVFARGVCEAILEGSSDFGILICGSGVGMCIAANRFKKIYAAVCHNTQVVRDAKRDDNINLVVLPANFISSQEALAILEVYLSTRFKGEARYLRRLEMLDNFSS